LIGKAIRSVQELEVYKAAVDEAMRIFELSKRFPKEETYSLTDQIRRSSRSVAANIAEAWRKRRYQAAFVAKLSDAETEASETQTWIEFAVKCGYVARDDGKRSFAAYNAIIGKLVRMIDRSEDWLIHPRTPKSTKDP
jgi:four helix bundle protein